MASQMARSGLEDYDAISVIPEEDPQPEVRSNRSSVRKVTFPRAGKKLAVLGFEDLLCDINTQCARTVGRPHLHDFLGKLYRHYDIAIWSDRRMDELEQMIARLGMDRHPEYNIICYVDNTEILTLSFPTGIILVKPLETVWKEYSGFNKTNTVICDTKQDRVVWNYENGIVASRYFYYNHDEDKELLLLSTYLKGIAHSNNLSQLEHNTWKYRVRRARKCCCVVM